MDEHISKYRTRYPHSHRIKYNTRRYIIDANPSNEKKNCRRAFKKFTQCEK
jgi:hypothetical protein